MEPSCMLLRGFLLLEYCMANLHSGDRRVRSCIYAPCIINSSFTLRLKESYLDKQFLRRSVMTALRNFIAQLVV